MEGYINQFSRVEMTYATHLVRCLFLSILPGLQSDPVIRLSVEESQLGSRLLNTGLTLNVGNARHDVNARPHFQ